MRRVTGKPVPHGDSDHDDLGGSTEGREPELPRAFAAVRRADLTSIRTLGSAGRAARMDGDVFLPGARHWLYRGDTLLHLSAALLQREATTLLLDFGADPNAINRRGEVPLHLACDPRPSGAARWDPDAQLRVIETLLGHAAVIDAGDRAGVTPLHRAARARSPRAVQALLSAGADPLVRTRQRGSTPLHMAAATANGAAGTFDAQVVICRLLIDAGASLADTDRDDVAVINRIRDSRLRDILIGDRVDRP
jgi:hypothetical protein